MRRNRDELRITPPVLGYDVLGSQFVFHPLGVGSFFIDLVDRNNDWHLSGARMLNRFLCLRHHTVVSRNDQNDNVGRFRSASAHRGKGRVSRCVQESNHAFIGLYVICTNVLRDTTCLTTGYA